MLPDYIDYTGTASGCQHPIPNTPLRTTSPACKPLSNIIIARQTRLPELIAPIDVTVLQKDKETRGSAYTKEDRVTEAGKRHAAGCSYYAHTYYGTAYADIINLRRKSILSPCPVPLCIALRLCTAGWKREREPRPVVSAKPKEASEKRACIDSLHLGGLVVVPREVSSTRRALRR